MAQDPLQIHVGESEKILFDLPKESVDCVVTSPPYDKLRTYNGNSDWDFPKVAAGLFHVLKPGGVLCWNVGDSVVKGTETLTGARQAIHFVDVAGFLCHDTMIYEKLNFSNPESVRYQQIFEFVYIFSKAIPPKTFNPIKDKKNVTGGAAGTLGVNTFTNPDGTKDIRQRKTVAEYGMRTNIWKGKTRGQEEMCEKLPHPAMMPRWLARDLILSWSNPEEVILDPFGGSGTTGQEALKLARKAILIDKDPSCLKLMDGNTTSLGLALF